MAGAEVKAQATAAATEAPGGAPRPPCNVEAQGRRWQLTSVGAGGGGMVMAGMAGVAGVAGVLARVATQTSAIATAAARALLWRAASST